MIQRWGWLAVCAGCALLPVAAVRAASVLELVPRVEVAGIGGRYTLEVRLTSTEPVWGAQWVLAPPPGVSVAITQAALPSPQDDAFAGYAQLDGFNRVRPYGELSARSTDVVSHGLAYGPERVPSPGQAYALLGVYTFEPQQASLGLVAFTAAEVSVYLADGSVRHEHATHAFRTARFGDANLDGAVDAEDLEVLQAHYRRSGAWADGDFTGDGMIGLPDLARLARNWSPAGQGDATPRTGDAVPEAASALALACGLVVGVLGRHRPGGAGT